MQTFTQKQPIQYLFFSRDTSTLAGFYHNGIYCPFEESQRVVRPLPQLIGEEDVFDSPLIAELCAGKLTAKEVRIALHDADFILYATTADNSLRGFAIAHVRPTCLYVDILVGSGCGGMLMDYITSLASQYPCTFYDGILLESIPSAIGFYVKKGFIPTGQYSKEGNPYYMRNINRIQYQRETPWTPNVCNYENCRPMLLT